MMTQHIMLSGIVAVGILMGGCANTGPGPDTPLTAEGFEPFPSARSFDPPGRVYRVSPEGTVFRVKLIEVDPEVGEESIAKLVSTQQLSLSQALENAGVAASTLTASATGALSRTREFTTESVDGTRLYLEDSQIDQVLPEALSDIRVRQGSRYYLIRETVMTRNLSYTGRTEWLTEAGLSAQLPEVLSGNFEFQGGEGEEFSLTREFDEPRHVWYKAERLEIERPFGAGPGQPVDVQLVSTEPGEFVLPPPEQIDSDEG
jgi:hypothetical protein